MAATNAAGLPIYDVNVPPRLLRRAGTHIADEDGTRVDVNADGDPLSPGGANVLNQPPLADRIAWVVRQAQAGGPTALPFLSAAGAAAARAGPTVARAPARVSRQAINYETRQGTSLYDRATGSIYSSSDDYFDLDNDTILDFVGSIGRRARECGWTGGNLFQVQVNTGTPAVIKNLLTQHGEVPLDKLREHILAIAIADPIVRAAQEDEQLFVCIMNSLTQSAIATVQLREDEYTLTDPTTPALNEMSGVMLFKIVISESQIETRSTINLLLSKLTSGLPKLMEEHGNNIKEFNMEVKRIV